MISRISLLSIEMLFYLRITMLRFVGEWNIIQRARILAIISKFVFPFVID